MLFLLNRGPGFIVSCENVVIAPEVWPSHTLIVTSKWGWLYSQIRDFEHGVNMLTCGPWSHAHIVFTLTALAILGKKFPLPGWSKGLWITYAAVTAFSLRFTLAGDSSEEPPTACPSSLPLTSFDRALSLRALVSACVDHWLLYRNHRTGLCNGLWNTAAKVCRALFSAFPALEHGKG